MVKTKKTEDTDLPAIKSVDSRRRIIAISSDDDTADSSEQQPAAPVSRVSKIVIAPLQDKEPAEIRTEDSPANSPEGPSLPIKLEPEEDDTKDVELAREAPEPKADELNLMVDEDEEEDDSPSPEDKDAEEEEVEDDAFVELLDSKAYHVHISTPAAHKRRALLAILLTVIALAGVAYVLLASGVIENSLSLPWLN